MKNRSSVTRGALLALLVAGGWVFVACHEARPSNFLGSGSNVVPPGPSPVVEEMRPVGGVTGVVLNGVGQLIVQQGAVDTLRVRTEEHILPFIETEQLGGLLTVGFKSGTSYHGQASAIEFHLTVSDLRSLNLSGTGNITASQVSTDVLSVVHTGVGSVDLYGLSATRLELNRSGIGSINVDGAVQQQSIVLGGMGTCDARNLASVEADVTILGSASATVQVSNRLTARIDGTGSVYYIGNPVVQRTGNGSGSVEPI